MVHTRPARLHNVCVCESAVTTSSSWCGGRLQCMSLAQCHCQWLFSSQCLTPNELGRVLGSRGPTGCTLIFNRLTGTVHL